MVFDIDGTREAARQRALPQTEELPPASRRLDEICAPGYRGRKTWQVVRTRTVISQATASNGSAVLARRSQRSYRVDCARASQQLHATSRHTSFRRACPAAYLWAIWDGAVLADLAGSCVRLSRTRLLSASTHRLLPILRCASLSGIRPISDLQKIDSAALSGGRLCLEADPQVFHFAQRKVPYHIPVRAIKRVMETKSPPIRATRR